MEHDIHLIGGSSPVPDDVAQRGAGRHKFTLDRDDSLEIVAVVDDGKIEGYEVFRDGKPVESFILHVTHDGTGPTNRLEPNRCFVCPITIVIGGDGGSDGDVHCYEVPCPGRGDGGT